jgi:cysteine-rich repeat protein
MAAGGASSFGGSVSTGGVFAGTGGSSSGHFEQCDDGNATPGDGCNGTCEIEAGYVCELPGQPCRQPKCGDGFVDWIPGSSAGGAGTGGAGTAGSVATAGFPGTGGASGGGRFEECDDGNGAPGDGCGVSCAVEPGYSCPEPGRPCKVAVCGDGIPDYPIEQCDDGNTVAGDGCVACHWEWIGGTGGQAGTTGGTTGF